MLPLSPFITCLQENLVKRGFGAKRLAEIVDRFEGTREKLHAAGVADADMVAMQNVLDRVALETREKARVALATLQTRARISRHFDEFDRNVAIARNTDEGATEARVAISLIEADPRSSGAVKSYATERDAARGQLYAIISDVVEKAGRGTFGIQKGKAHLPNIVRELYGEATGDRVAGELAKSWSKMTDAAVDMINAAGGSMVKLKDWRLPQSTSIAKLVKAGRDEWKAFHMQALDWARMEWPNGAPIKEADRPRVLDDVYNTLSSDGENQIKPGDIRGRGAALGQMLDQHRFLFYKDSATWMAAHEKYGDGSIFDVMTRYVDTMAHQIGLVQTFGANPQAMADTIRDLARQRASRIGAKEHAATKAALRNIFDPMFDTVMRTNRMDPESFLGNTIIGTANILNAAQLGSAVLLAAPGDLSTTIATRIANGMPMLGDSVKFYIDALAADRPLAARIATQTGFVHDTAVQAIYAAQRFSGLNTIGPAITRRIADTTMRLSLMSGHTEAAKFSARTEFMGLLQRSRNVAFDDLPFVQVFERYGIDDKMWDAMRQQLPVYSPPGRANIQLFAPNQILTTRLSNREELYRAFQGMILEEARRMVPEASIEGQVFLRGTTRPDTLPGALLHSFSMYKSFPVTLPMIYGRLAMSNPDRAGRLSFVAGLAAAMTLTGALGVQMREIAKGRDPRPMDNPAFWGQALLAGGSLSILGDFLFNGINRVGQGPADTAAGPIVSFVGDTTQLVFGDVFTFADHMGTLKGDKDKMKMGARAVEYARRYTLGASIWYARAALERSLFDRLQELDDPDAYKKQRARVRRQEREIGNTYFWAPGDRTPERAPRIQGDLRP